MRLLLQLDYFWELPNLGSLDDHVAVHGFVDIGHAHRTRHPERGVGFISECGAELVLIARLGGLALTRGIRLSLMEQFYGQ